jgi:hypothetical protein
MDLRARHLDGDTILDVLEHRVGGDRPRVADWIAVQNPDVPVGHRPPTQVGFGISTVAVEMPYPFVPSACSNAGNATRSPATAGPW